MVVRTTVSLARWARPGPVITITLVSAIGGGDNDHGDQQPFMLSESCGPWIAGSQRVRRAEVCRCEELEALHEEPEPVTAGHVLEHRPDRRFVR